MPLSIRNNQNKKENSEAFVFVSRLFPNVSCLYVFALVWCIVLTFLDYHKKLSFRVSVFDFKNRDSLET